MRRFGERMRDTGLQPGMIRPENSRNLKDFMAGLEDKLKNSGEKFKGQLGKVRDTADQLLGTGNMRIRQPDNSLRSVDSREAARQMLSQQDAGLRARQVTHTPETPARIVTRTDPRTGRTQTATIAAIPATTRRRTENFTGELKGEMAAHGALLNATSNLPTGQAPHLTRGGQAHVSRSPFSGDRVVRTPISSRWKGRALGYAALPAAEYMYRSWLNAQQRGQKVTDLLTAGTNSNQIVPIRDDGSRMPAGGR